MEKRIDWNEKPSVVSLLGNESFFKKKSLDRAMASLEDFHVEKYVAGEDTDEEIKNALFSASSPFFSMEKLIVIQEANKFGDRDLLRKYCENPSDDNIVIMISSNRGKDAKWFKNLNTSKTIKCEKISDWDLGEWLVSEARRNGYMLKKEFAEAIVMNVGNHLPSLYNELEKLFVYCDDNIIQSKDIQDILYSHSSLSPFEVIRYWGLGNKNASLQFLVRHFEKTPETNWVRSEMVLIKGLSDRIENLIKARSMKNTGVGVKKIASSLGMSKWLYNKKVAEQVKTRSIKELTKAYRSICEVESKSKMGKSGRLLLQLFIIHN